MPTAVKRRKQAARLSSRRVRSKSGKAGRTAAKVSRGRSPKPIVIDVHAHVLVPEVVKRTFEHSQYARGVAVDGGVPEPLLKRMTELPLRLNEMDATGVDMQVVSPSIMQQCTYGFEPQEALELDRRSNDRVAEIVAQHKDRLIGLGSLRDRAGRRALAIVLGQGGRVGRCYLHPPRRQHRETHAPQSIDDHRRTAIGGSLRTVLADL